MPILAGIAPILGGVITGITGSSGARNAGRTVGAAGTAVGNSVDTATNGAIGAGYQGLAGATSSLGQGWEQVGNTNNLQSQIYNNTQSNLSPYMQAGAQGASGMQSLLSNYQPFSFNPNDVSQNPAYKFQLQQGTQALQSQAAAAGMLQSGSNEKGIENYAQGLASTYENQMYQQALGTYQTNYSNQLQGLGQLAGLGQTANSQNIQLGLGYGNQAGQTAGLSTSLAQAGANASLQGQQYIGNVGLQGTVDAGNFYMGGAQGTAAGQMGAANAWGGAINGIGQGLGGLSTLLGTPAGGSSATGGDYGGNGIYTGSPSNPITLPGYGPLPVSPITGPGAPMGPG